MDEESTHESDNDSIVVGDDCDSSLEALLSLELEQLFMPLIVNAHNSASSESYYTHLHDENLVSNVVSTEVSIADAAASLTTKQPLMINPRSTSHPVILSSTTRGNTQDKSTPVFRECEHYPNNSSYNQPLLPQPPQELSNNQSNMQMYKHIPNTVDEINQTISDTQRTEQLDMAYESLPKELLIPTQLKGKHDLQRSASSEELIHTSSGEILESQTNDRSVTIYRVQMLEIEEESTESDPKRKKYSQSKEKRFHCDVQENRLYNKSHKLIQSGQKQFQDEIDSCQEKFSSKLHLNED